MEWNENGELKYYTNDIQIGRMIIDRGLVYFPCVCRGRKVGAIDIQTVWVVRKIDPAHQSVG